MRETYEKRLRLSEIGFRLREVGFKLRFIEIGFKLGLPLTPFLISDLWTSAQAISKISNQPRDVRCANDGTC